jgi:hypothetical protein
MSGVSGFGSDTWLPALNELCFEYLKNLAKRPGSRFVKFRDELLGTAEKPGPIVQEYHDSAIKFKVETFDKNAPTSHIDHHKIAALYIRAFLIHKPFFNDPPAKYPDVSLYALLPNEYFSILFLETIFRAWSKDFTGELRMPKPYYDNFIKLLHHFLLVPSSLDVVSFSNIIYLIENQYFIHLS